MDWRIYHSINTFVADHSWLGRLFHGIETYGTYLIAVAAVLLWLAARPGGDRKWKIASGSALSARMATARRPAPSMDLATSAAFSAER